jgi:diacylglycerol kinase (ATP)
MNDPEIRQQRRRRISRSESFVCAFRGLALLLKTQTNARIHLLVTCTITAVGLSLSISRMDWMCVALAAGCVWSAEGLNTAVEFLTDRVSPEWSTAAAHVKDVAAGAVLLSAMAAAIVGVLVFVPPLWRLLVS